MQSIVEALKNYKPKEIDPQGNTCPGGNPYKPVRMC